MTPQERMNLREHLFYQELLTEQSTLSDTVRTFEKVIVDTGIASLTEMRQKAAVAPSSAGQIALIDGGADKIAEQHYGALLIHTVFSSFTDTQVRDFINLVHKETLARRVSMLLHTDDVNLHEVEIVLAEFTALPIGESQISPNIAIGIRVQLISSFISDNLFYVGVAKFHITMRDVDALMQRFIGKYGQRSRVGGKSAGSILANRILKPVFGEPSGFEDQIEEVESYYLTAQVFSRFIEHNRLEEGHDLKYLETEERERVRADLEVRFYRGVFPEDTAAQIGEILEKLGDDPLIVRSSSLLEDSMGFPFYGKYDSVFISNQGTIEERCEELMRAIKSVYVSMLSSSVIEYRKDKALLDYDDKMSVLIQQVVGRRYGKYFFPATAGVAFSHNQYCWSHRIDPKDGVARIVHGLGTRAVDRGGDDYPRLVSLGHPELRPEGSLNEKLKYSQRFVDVLNLETRGAETVHFVDLYNYIRSEGENGYTPSQAVSLISDGRFETPTFYPDSLDVGAAAITFDTLLGRTSFPGLLRGVLQMLASSFGVPVDVEFAWEGDKLYILQCRPLAEWSGETRKVEVPTPSAKQRVLFETKRDIFRSAAVEEIRYIVYVDGAAYDALPTPSEKLEVARTVGRVNRALKGHRFIIMGPGRWGSVNLTLGVKVGYGDINNALMLVEIALERGGYRPEVSYGTHFFQDLIEADIIPLPLFPGDAGSLELEFLQSAPSTLGSILRKDLMPPQRVAEAVKVIDLDAVGPGRMSVYLDAGEIRGSGLLG
ncbi:MAG: PEP/pyruvate-binding domain-containing protein [Spirochaetales bacterium]|nr:PEP/pyruvate-binding domain-containing protein [Spirochaetales bacterium]